jgi:hypothetical protein
MSTNHHPSQTKPGRPDAEVYKAARIYLEDHFELAVDFIARECDAKELLRAACEAKGNNFHRVMSQGSNPDEETRSQVSRHRTSSSNSRSEGGSSSSVVFSSSGSTSDPSSASAIWVLPENDSSPTPLKARRISHSDYLIRADLVPDRWTSRRKRLSDTIWVRYKGGSLPSQETISLPWARDPKDLKSGKAQKNTLYLVEHLPEIDVVLGNSASPNSPIFDNGTLSLLLARLSAPKLLPELPFNPTVRPNSLGDYHAGQSPPLNIHGLAVLEQRVYTDIDTADSTAPTVRQTDPPSNRVSGIGIGSGSVNSPGAPGRFTYDTSNMAPSGRTNVTLVCEGSERVVRIELDAPGESLFNTLKKGTRKMGHTLKRDVDHVRFATNKDGVKINCYVELTEKEVKDDWANAADWINRHKSSCKIYAFIEQEQDDEEQTDEEQGVG